MNGSKADFCHQDQIATEDVHDRFFPILADFFLVSCFSTSENTSTQEFAGKAGKHRYFGPLVNLRRLRIWRVKVAMRGGVNIGASATTNDTEVVAWQNQDRHAHNKSDRISESEYISVSFYQYNDVWGEPGAEFAKRRRNAGHREGGATQEAKPFSHYLSGKWKLRVISVSLFVA